MQQKNISLSTQEASIMNTFEMFESNIQIRLPENWNQFDNKFVKRPPNVSPVNRLRRGRGDI